MNVAFSSDDNYARHLGQAIYSLLCNNTEEPSITVYILNVRMSKENQDKLTSITDEFGRDIVFVDLSDIEDRLTVANIQVRSFSIEAYARLFLEEILPEALDRVLWLDCDVSVLAPIKDYYHCDLTGYAAAGIIDQPNFGLDLLRIDSEIYSETEAVPFFCAGCMLYNLEYMRANKLQKEFINYLRTTSSELKFMDMSILNHVLFNKIKKVPFKFHIITPAWFLTYNQMVKRWGTPFYTKEEYKEGKKHPVMVHYTNFRPWKKWCLHPKRNVYRHYLDQTPWKGYPLEDDDLFGVVKGRIISLFHTAKVRLLGK